MDTKRRDFLSLSAAAATFAAAAPLIAQTTRPQGSAAAACHRLSEQAPAAADGPDFEVPEEIKKLDVLNLREIEAEAQKVIPLGSFGYIASAAGDE